MEPWKAITLGTIEGITEFLPISSTAHLLLAGKFLSLSGEFEKTFVIAIQLGAILAIAGRYAKEILSSRDLFKKLIIAFIPTATVGFALYKVIKKVFFETTHLILASLFLGGIILILFELKQKKDTSDKKDISQITNKDAFLIGCAQSIAVIPGVSRAGATIVGGMMRKINRKAITEFSFLLAVPTMISAVGYDLLKTGFAFAPENFPALIIGTVIAAITAHLTVSLLLKYVQNHTFIFFGIYRIGVAIFIWTIL